MDQRIIGRLRTAKSESWQDIAKELKTTKEAVQAAAEHLHITEDIRTGSGRQKWMLAQRKNGHKANGKAPAKGKAPPVAPTADLQALAARLAGSDLLDQLDTYADLLPQLADMSSRLGGYSEVKHLLAGITRLG